MLAAGLKLPLSAAAHTSYKPRICTVGRPAAAASAHPFGIRAIATSNATMTSGTAAAELDALVQDAIVWASQHGLVGGALAPVLCQHNSWPSS